MSKETVPDPNAIDAKALLEWLRSTVGGQTLDGKAVLEYVTVAAKGLRISRVEGDEEGSFEEIDFPLAVHGREDRYKSKVCLQRDDGEQPWEVCIYTASEGTLSASEARDFAAQVGRAASLGERLNVEAARHSQLSQLGAKAVPPASWRIEQDTDGSDWLWWSPEMAVPTSGRTAKADVCFSTAGGFSASVGVHADDQDLISVIDQLSIEELRAVIEVGRQALAAYDALPAAAVGR